MISFILNLPYTIIGLLIALLSIPIEIKFQSRPYAFVIKIKKFWWATGHHKNARAMTVGHVVLLGPNLENKDLEHELIHVEQYQRLPFIFPFLYYIELIQHGYINNKYEDEAYKKAGNLYKENNMNSHQEIISEIIKKEFNQIPIQIDRIKIGMDNEVYKITLPEGEFIIRMNKHDSRMKGSEINIPLFTSLEINVPKIIVCDYSQTFVPFSYQIMSKIEGKDLGLVIESMTDDQLKQLAKEVVAIFKKLATIPTNGKFGWVGVDESRLVDSWAKVMKADKIQERNNQTGVVGVDLVNKEKELYEKYVPYFNSVKSVFYFDDMNSKNILITKGIFSGLVDLDDIMYGDPLEAVGAIKASWYGTHYGDLYTKAIEDEMNLADEERKIVTAYATLNRILWLSEKGIKFNDNTSSNIDTEAVKRDKEVIEKLFLELE
jgi:aminoglycoside phosphotransferase (APT) family kinase protein